MSLSGESKKHGPDAKESPEAGRKQERRTQPKVKEFTTEFTEGSQRERLGKLVNSVGSQMGEFEGETQEIGQLFRSEKVERKKANKLMIAVRKDTLDKSDADRKAIQSVERKKTKHSKQKKGISALANSNCYIHPTK